MIPMSTFQNGKYSTFWIGSDPLPRDLTSFRAGSYGYLLQSYMHHWPGSLICQYRLGCFHSRKQASIRPIPKVPAPSGHADFRPISITPVLTRLVEKTVVRSFLYPAFLKPPPSLSFQDQYAFQPTGSTTAAIISILHNITSLLITDPYVIVIAIDFSKAFDTVRHFSLL